VRRQGPSEEGAVLVFALLVVIIVMTISTSLLTVSSTNFRATTAYGDQAGNSGAAEAAVQTTANTIRRTLFNNSAGQHCFPDAAGSLTGGSDSFPLNDLVVEGSRHYSATVTCSHAPGSSSPVLINASNRPGMAILTLGDLTASGEPGLSIKALNAIAFKVHGAIYSNSDIQLVQGSVVDDQGVYAKRPCNAATIAGITPPPICSFSGATPSGADPGYAAAVTTVPGYVGAATYGAAATPLPFDQTFPNACKNTIVTFQPGYYDDAVELSKMMSSSGCAGSTFWFKPGPYYFDFHNGEDQALSGSSHVWTADTGSVVAGTPATADRKPVVNPTIPNSCVNPISKDNSTVDQGVQFAFGGDSQFVVNASKAEICGTYSTGSPPIAVYGVSSGDETLTTQGPLRMNTTSDSGNFANLNGIRTAGDGSVSTWTNNQSGNGTRTGASTATGYTVATTPPIPGTTLSQALLTVVHGDSAGTTQDSVKVTVKLPDNSSFDLTVPTYGDNALHTDVVDFSANATFLKYIHSAGLNNPISLTYAASVKHAGTETVDGMTLAMKYRLPAFRSEALSTINGTTNCLTVAYTGTGGSACAAIVSTQAPGNQFYIQGTAYLPKAALDISLNQATSQVFKFGVIARSLQVKVTGSSTFDQPIIEIPDDSPGNVVSTNVILSAYVCAGTSACSASGTPALRARVALIDPDPGAVLAGLRALNIQSWSTPGRSGG
jgi:Tfp pilus assembly protein PilX